VVHYWVYDGKADREQRRAAMAANSAWQASLQRAAEAAYLLHRRNRISRSAAHWTLLPRM
jgi:hypothetical protein